MNKRTKELWVKIPVTIFNDSVPGMAFIQWGKEKEKKDINNKHLSDFPPIF